jgi:ATP-dependent DNA helicase RecG
MNGSHKLPLEMPLDVIPGIAQKFSKYLKKLGIETVRDLLWHFPARYEDFSQIRKIADLEPGEQATVQGKVEEINLRRTWRRNFTIVEAVIGDESGNIKAIWFNQPYVANSLRMGREANFAGKISVSQEGELYLNNPAYELAHHNAEEQETRHTARLVPIYPETRGLTSKGLRFLIQPILKNTEDIPEWIPAKILKENNLPETNDAFASIHFPHAIEDAMTARNRFSFEDLFLLQLWNIQQKLKLKEEKAHAVATDIERLKTIIEKLPFELTLSQKKSLWEILKDIEKSTPMNRLLQGDVGSGKTVVAALAGIVAAEHGYQTAFMAPTEILARQHFETLKNILKRTGVACEVGFLTSGGAKLCYEDGLEADIPKKELREHVQRGEVKIVIGTHALISEANDEATLSFKNLALVIVDEQHRFGVAQRAALLSQTYKPHFLSMSATPIPRTLMMTVFGDLDISTITELPAGRKHITTKVVLPEERIKTYEFIREEAQKGRQTFVICPRIEPASVNEGEVKIKEFKKLELKSVKEEFERLSKKVFPDLRLAMLHGQLKSKEKERIMGEFMGGTIDVLVSTSVVEVGVDIKNATIMMIEGSDRFGLAQLYQFRGRVGRGEHQSYCFLLTDSKGASTQSRLKAIVEAKNGFELAEKDLKIRGPGEFLGQSQSGLPDVAMKALTNVELVKSSRAAAAAITKADPSLKEYPLLRTQMEKFQRGIHLE